MVVIVAGLVAAGCSRSSSGSSKPKTSGAASTVASGDFGTLKGVCGPGNAKGATAPGVADGTITVGTMADPGAPSQPGLDQELFDSADAFVAWCNAAGGILGRRLVLHKWDSKLTEVASRMIASCSSDFALVGNGEALDEGGVEQRVKCGLPEIPTYDVSKKAGTAPLSVQPLPNPDYSSGLYAAYVHLKQVDPEAAKHYAMLSSQFQSVKDAGNKDRAAAEAAGYTTVHYDELPLVVDNWRPYVQNLQTKGVQVVTVESSPQPIAAMYKAMDDVGYHPRYAIFNTNMYDPTFVENAGSALQGSVYISSVFVPFERAASGTATKQYIDDLAKYANGAKPKQLGAQAWSAWLLFAESANACGSNLTRSCLLDHAKSRPSWTGGGLHAPSHPGDATAPGPQCFVLLQASPTGFTVDTKVTKPNTGVFNCSPSNAFRLPGFPR